MKPEENLLCVKTHYQMDVKKKKALSLLMIMIMTLMTMVTMTIMMIAFF